MRQGQQNRRGRGRNRKGQNPLTRSFESSGPDIKIRGTPSHIAEKYVSLARDALASGDPVLAENYLQHAEHYNRIIMSYREQQSPSSEGLNGSSEGRHRSQDASEQLDAEDLQDFQEDSGYQQPQSVIMQDNVNGEGAEDGPAEIRTERRERRPRRGNGIRSPRPRRDEAQRENAPAGNLEGNGEVLANNRGKQDAFSKQDSPPDFLKRPVRRTRSAIPKEDHVTSPNDLGNSADKTAE